MNFKQIRPLRDDNGEVIALLAGDVDELDPGMFITANDVDLDDDDLLYEAPKELFDAFDRVTVDAILIGIVQAIDLAQSKASSGAYEAGIKYGTKIGRREVRDILGITDIVQSFANAAESIAHQVGEREFKL